MKNCIKCKQDKELKDFRVCAKSKDGHQVYCTICDKQRQREYYLKNREQQLIKAKITKSISNKRNIEFILDYFKKHPCCKCGESDPIVLDFDHIGNKTHKVSVLVARGSLEKLKTEINKCQVLCSNCHRRKTAKDFKWHKYNITLK